MSRIPITARQASHTPQNYQPREKALVSPRFFYDRWDVEKKKSGNLAPSRKNMEGEKLPEPYKRPLLNSATTESKSYNNMTTSIQTNRRAFLAGSVLTLFCEKVAVSEQTSPLRIGMITDLHYADKDARGSRHYRESLQKIEEATRSFQTAKVDFVVELGDLIDEAKDAITETAWLQEIDSKFKKMPGRRNYVLGNHCVATLSKTDFLKTVGQEKSYYSFDAKGVHVVVLDACFRKDGVEYDQGNFNWQDCAIPAKELNWLRSDLKSTKLPTVVFVHQRLDDTERYSVKNASEVRGVLEKSGKVMAVFQGHNHKNEHREVNGIHYCTLTAMVEGRGEANNGYAILTVEPNGNLTIDGFRKQANYKWG